MCKLRKDQQDAIVEVLAAYVGRKSAVIPSSGKSIGMLDFSHWIEAHRPGAWQRLVDICGEDYPHLYRQHWAVVSVLREHFQLEVFEGGYRLVFLKDPIAVPRRAAA